jgi:hypothetical protein
MALFNTALAIMAIHIFDAAWLPPYTPLICTLHVSAETVDKAWDKIAYERPGEIAGCSKFTHIDSVPDGCDLPESPHPVISF